MPTYPATTRHTAYQMQSQYYYLILYRVHTYIPTYIHVCTVSTRDTRSGAPRSRGRFVTSRRLSLSRRRTHGKKSTWTAGKRLRHVDAIIGVKCQMGVNISQHQLCTADFDMAARQAFPSKPGAGPRLNSNHDASREPLPGQTEGPGTNETRMITEANS